MRGLGLVPRLAVLGIKNSKSKPRSSWVNVDNMCIKRQTELARPGAVFNGFSAFQTKNPLRGCVQRVFSAFQTKNRFPQFNLRRNVQRTRYAIWTKQTRSRENRTQTTEQSNISTLFSCAQ
jgi:hypothetical protein